MSNLTKVKSLDPKKWQILARNASRKFLKRIVTLQICGEVGVVVTEDDMVYMVGDNVGDEDEQEEQEWNKKNNNSKKKKKKSPGLLKIDFLCGRRITAVVIGGGNWPEMEQSKSRAQDPEEQLQRRPTRSSIPGRTHFFLALTDSGDLYSWGVNNQGQLGRGGGGGEESTPARILSLSTETIVQAAAGTAHCLALTSDGKVYGWGLNEFGQCGSEKKVVAHLSPTLVNLDPALNIDSVYCGSSHSAALTRNGQVFCWGCNGRGQLGVGDLECRRRPTLVRDLSSLKISAVALGSLHTLALDGEAGLVHAWGRNDGQSLLVNSSEAEVTSPSRVNRLHRIDGIVSFHDSNICLATKKKATFIWGLQNQDKPLKSPNKKRKNIVQISYKLLHTPCFTTKE